MAKVKKLRELKPYLTYNAFDAEGHDLIIENMRTLHRASGLKLTELAEITGLSASTPANWFKAKVKRPQWSSVMAFTRGCGYDVQFVEMKRTNNAGISLAKLLRPNGRSQRVADRMNAMA